MDNHSKIDPEYFRKRYELLSSSAGFKPNPVKSLVCRYCKKSEPETSFKQVTHLLPELLGQNNLHTYDECDKCNALFSSYESNLAIYIRPYITLLGIRGKNKVPAFQSRSINRDENSRTTLQHAEDNRKELIINNIDDYKINKEDKTFEILFRKPPFRPVSIYKALLKIGLSLLPVEFDKYNKRAFDLLLGKDTGLPFIRNAFITTLKRSYFKHPYADLYKARKLVDGNKEFPEYILILCFANQVIQIFLPFSEELLNVSSGKRTLEVNLYPAFAMDKNHFPDEIRFNVIDLGIDDTVTEDHRMMFSYQNAELNTPQGKLASETDNS